MEVYYAPVDLICDGAAVLTGDEFHHLTRVMRHVIGDEIHIADGQGTMYRARIESLDGKADCSVLDTFAGCNEASIAVTLVFSLLKNPGRMDWLIEKATELGVRRIIPMTTDRTVARNVKLRRWRDIATAAMKQSSRCYLPVIEGNCAYRDVFGMLADERLLLFHETVSPGYAAADRVSLRDNQPVAVIIGPEGGFTDDEVAVAIGRQAEICSLGTRRLRAETAALAALARIVK